MSEFYSAKICERFNEPKHIGSVDNANANGRWASFICGVSVRFSLNINGETKKIRDAKFKTNGCGFVIATADYLCERISGSKLTELRGLEDLENDFKRHYGEFPEGRGHCSDICFDALQNALAEYRSKQIEEWTGEKALICTCFGVSEGRIEKEIARTKLETVEAIGDICNAGTGCGSCQPLIQEILDSQEFN